MDEFIDSVEQQFVVGYGVRDRFETLEPPGSIDEVNQVMVDTLARIIAGAEALVVAADTVSNLEEIQRTSEFAEYPGVNSDAVSMCQDVQAKLNDPSARPVIEGPWISDPQRTVSAYLGCDDAGPN